MAMMRPKPGRPVFKPTNTRVPLKPKPKPTPTKPPKPTNAQIAAAAIRKAAAAKKKKAAGPVGTGAQGISGYRGSTKPKPKPRPTVRPTAKPTATMRPRKMPTEAQLLKEWNESAGGKRAGGSYNDFILRKRKEYGYKNQFPSDN